MPTYTVTSDPANPVEVEFSDGKKMHRYDVDVKGEDHTGEVRFWRPPDKRLEGVEKGKTLNLVLEKKKGGVSAKFEKANQGGGQAGEAALGYEDPPIKRASMGRAHAQEMALLLIGSTGDAKELDLSEASITGTYLNTVVKRLADWFHADVLNAAPAPQSASNGTQQSDVPADTSGLVQAPAPSSDDVPF